MGADLDFLFHPRSIAVAGASADPQNRGYQVIETLIQQGYRGGLYAVHPRAEAVLGKPGYASVLAVPGPVDYVISNVPAASALQLVDECARKGVRAIAFFTARFGETGHADRADLERQLLRRAREGGVRVLGPNCMGIYYPAGGMSFKHWPHEPGPVGLFSQSGGNCMETVHGSAQRGVRFSKVVSYGNSLDINEADLMEHLAADPETRVIGAYVEGAREGRRFLRALGDAVARKPVVLWKGGRTPAGRRAAASHTASLAGSDEVWRALARQTGAALVESLEELCDMLVAFSFCRPATGRRAAVCGSGGGRAVESADACSQEGLVLEALPPAVGRELQRRYPDLWDWIGNPADGSILGGSDLTDREIFGLMAQAPEYDLLIGNVGETWAMDGPQEVERMRTALDGWLAAARSIDKPVAFVMRDTLAETPWENEALGDARRRTGQAGVALFPTVRRAARALSRLTAFYRERAAREPASRR